MTHGVHDFTVTTIDGETKSLADYHGKVLLIVNTASRCGFTPQYEPLEALYQRYRDRGFEVLAFPANNFMRQEPGTNSEIKQFCSLKFRTTFPLFAKISVKGKDIAPLYAYLTRDSGYPGDVSWNFAKFLVAPDGGVVARFDPATDPLDRKITDRIEHLQTNAVADRSTPAGGSHHASFWARPSLRRARSASGPACRSRPRALRIISRLKPVPEKVLQRRRLS